MPRAIPIQFMKAGIFVLAFAVLTIFISLIPTKIQAQEKASGSSATLQAILIEKVNDHRAHILEKYLNQYDSPLAQYADDFVTQADMYGLDWRLLVSISGVESTFGKAVPCTNAWGWDIYGDHMHCFASYSEAIHTISKDLRENYMNRWRAEDVWTIGQYYAASPTWAQRVNYFMNDIDKFSMNVENNPLPISL